MYLPCVSAWLGATVVQVIAVGLVIARRHLDTLGLVSV